MNCSVMTESFKWLSEKEAGEVLEVAENTLDELREEGYLKPGVHWRSSTDPKTLPWKPKAFYSISRCKEVIEYLKDIEAPHNHMTA